VWATLTLVLLVGGYWYSRGEANEVRRDRYETIAAVGELKSSQIQRWRKERLADGRRVARAPAIGQAVTEFLLDSARLDRRTRVRTFLQSQRMEDVYDDVLLLAPNGRILLAAKDTSNPTGPATQRALAAALTSPEAALSDFFRDRDGAVDIDVAIALRDDAKKLLGVVVLRSRAESYLYPLIQSWPTPSHSAETVLIQRDGQNALMLSDLRHRPNTALSVVPLKVTNDPAVQAVLGRSGKFEGMDHNGAEVLADLSPIPGSPWFVMTKVDVDEIMAEAHDRAALIGAIVASLILLVATATAYGYRQRQVEMFRDLYESERQRREVNDAFHTTLSRIGEGIISTDANGLVRTMNSVAERLTGWTEQDARGKHVEEVFHEVDEGTRVTTESPVPVVLRLGAIVEKARHFTLIARDGTEHPIFESAAPIRDEHGAVTGMVLAFSDQTSQLAAREALRESEERLRLALAAANQGTYDINPQTDIWKVSAEVATMLGYDPAEFRVSTGEWLEMLHPDDETAVMRRFTEHVAGVLPVFQAEFRLRTKAGDWRWVRSVGKIVARTGDGRPLRMLGTHTDITERKQTEQALRENAERLEQVIHMTHIGIFDHDHLTGVTYWSPQQRQIYGVDADSPCNLAAYLSLVHPEDRESVLPATQRAHDPASDGLFDIENRIIRPDGDIRWLTTRSQTFFDGEGAARHPIRTVGAVKDRTDRKAAEAEVRL
jgi:PAS domain S-box-containing protein